MNPKQFLSSSIFAGVDFWTSRVPILGPVISIPFRVIFPTMGYERVSFKMMRPQLFLSVYLTGFLICFVLQAVLAYQAGHLGSLTQIFSLTMEQKAAGARVLFLQDGHNLFNYTLLVPLYLVAGTGYIVALFSLPQRMSPVMKDHGFNIAPSHQPFLSGVPAIAIFLIILVFAQANYATDVRLKSDFLFWFHGETKTSPFNFNGYAYLIINVFLASWVIFIALLHLELFRWSSSLAKVIRSYSGADEDSESLFFRDGDRLKELFAPFTETAIWSKAFAMLLAMNIYTWLDSGVSGGKLESMRSAAESTPGVSGAADESSLFFKLITVLYYVIVLWIVSLPRYRVQYELFKLRTARGIHDYFDIRMPWTIGWSVFIDLLLIAFFSTAVFGSGQFIDFIFSIFEKDVTG